MATVHVLNTDNLHTGNSVEVHSPGCQHMARYKRNPWFQPGFDEEFDSPQAVFNDYNADFYAEDGDDSCWPVMVFPCTGLVKRKTEVTTWKDLD